MALIKHAQAHTIARDAVVLDLAEISRQGADMVSRARAQAERILAEAEMERDRLIGTAAQEGIRRGHEEGYAAGYAEGARKGEAAARADVAARLGAVAGAWESAMISFEARRDDMLLAARTEALALALEIARKVTKRHAEVDGAIVRDQMDAALRMVTHPSRLVLSVCPDDIATARAELERVRGVLASARHAEIVEDPALSRGSVLVRTGRGVIDATIETQIERMVSALMPGGIPRAEQPAPAPGVSDVHAPRAPDGPPAKKGEGEP